MLKHTLAVGFTATSASMIAWGQPCPMLAGIYRCDDRAQVETIEIRQFRHGRRVPITIGKASYLADNQWPDHPDATRSGDLYIQTWERSRCEHDALVVERKSRLVHVTGAVIDINVLSSWRVNQSGVLDLSMALTVFDAAGQRHETSREVVCTRLQ